ncbi:MAG TPA: hypothetical protein QF571_00860 [Desulfobacterales bacterium]|nr:hypothetical protein [Desulfobacterales bacterium]HJO61356.1 hypothetical protein [Desulfobacterales bacterium]
MRFVGASGTSGSYIRPSFQLSVYPDIRLDGRPASAIYYFSGKNFGDFEFRQLSSHSSLTSEFRYTPFLVWLVPTIFLQGFGPFSRCAEGDAPMGLGRGTYIPSQSFISYFTAKGRVDFGRYVFTYFFGRCFINHLFCSNVKNDLQSVAIPVIVNTGVDSVQV